MPVHLGTRAGERMDQGLSPRRHGSDTTSEGRAGGQGRAPLWGGICEHLDTHFTAPRDKTASHSIHTREGTSGGGSGRPRWTELTSTCVCSKVHTDRPTDPS